MKLLSCKSTINYGQIVCNDGIFDPNLISDITIDPSEKFISFYYDANECGAPLNLPFNVENARFNILLTKYDLHMGVVVQIDEETACTHENYLNECGDIEFNIRMSPKEKLTLLTYLFYDLLNSTNF